MDGSHYHELEVAFERAAKLINQLADGIRYIGNVDFAALNEHWIFAERLGYGKDKDGKEKDHGT